MVHGTKPFIVIGGGIIGSAIAREILLKKLGDVIVLEKEVRLGEHASGRNSNVIHSGINQFPGSLKATLCLEGSKRLRQYCRDHQVPVNECGTLVAAQNKEQERVLYTLLGMGLSVGVPGIKILTKEELLRREPAITGSKALFSPTGAVTDSLAVLEAVAREVKSMGGAYHYSSEAIGISETKVITTEGDFEGRHLINCAGLYSDKIAHMMNVGMEYRIIPFRGEYMEVKNVPVQSMVYQTPNLKFPFLSVHLTRETDGKLLGGPTATLSFGREAYDKQINFRETGEMFASPHLWRLFLSRDFLGLAVQNAAISFLKSEFLKEIRKICPAVKPEDIIPHRSGIRAQMVDRKGKMLDDMLVEFRDGSTHVLNCVSPGMTSSFAFAEYVVSRIKR